MTREELLQEILRLKGSNWLLELATGTGKTKMAIEKIRSQEFMTSYNTLVVVPRNVHKKNWEDEFNKWWPGHPLNITYTTYVSFPKYKGNWDFVIFDECHHLSERCREALCDFSIRHSVLLSATVSKALKDELREVFDDLVSYKKDLRDVIDDNILPDPTVYLFPLTLRNDEPTEFIVKNPKSRGKMLECNWATRWNYIKQKNNPVKIYCTEEQYHADLYIQINYWKNRYISTRSEIARNKWLKLCSNRLKWLSDKKLGFLYKLIANLKDYRTLIFCNSIEQTELLGEYCINSKNSNSIKNLSDFNSGKINHITACNMLNEGRHTCPYLSNSVEVKYINKLRKRA